MPHPHFPVRLLAAGGESFLSGSQMALLGLVMLATTLMMMSARRRRQRDRNTPKAYVREHASRLREERQVMGDVESVMLQLDQLAREITGEIDLRFAKLEKVIRDADARIDRLQRLTRAANGQATVDVTIGEATGEDPGVDPTPSRYEEIRALHLSGLSAVQIAERVGQATGEIELILALHGHSARKDHGPEVVAPR